AVTQTTWSPARAARAISPAQSQVSSSGCAQMPRMVPSGLSPDMSRDANRDVRSPPVISGCGSQTGCMTSTNTHTHDVHALPAALLDEVRSTGVDASGTPAERVVATGGEALRCWLRDAGGGEGQRLQR